MQICTGESRLHCTHSQLFGKMAIGPSSFPLIEIIETTKNSEYTKPDMI
ncbi:hypothetical protein J4206_07290 [Candidatus Woesearchaeota archaeon]|nr:hypothetical protein [Candidatus Woesearchaeota archaeon]